MIILKKAKKSLNGEEYNCCFMNSNKYHYVTVTKC